MLCLKGCERSKVIHAQYLKSLYLELKALGQCGCEQWKGFSPVWLKAWSRSFSCEANRAPHTKHSFPLTLPTSSAPPSSSLSLSLSFPFSRSLSLSVRGSGAALPNSLVAVRRPSSSGVSAVIRCEASAAAAAMAALECRCHENPLVAPLPCRLNVESCGGRGGTSKSDGDQQLTGRASGWADTSRWTKICSEIQNFYFKVFWVTLEHFFLFFYFLPVF